MKINYNDIAANALTTTVRVPGGWVSGRYRPPFKEPAGWSVVALRWKPSVRWGA
jgi:hypothetical protein